MLFLFIIGFFYVLVYLLLFLFWVGMSCRWVEVKGEGMESELIWCERDELREVEMIGFFVVMLFFLYFVMWLMVGFLGVCDEKGREWYGREVNEWIFVIYLFYIFIFYFLFWFFWYWRWNGMRWDDEEEVRVVR